MIASMTAFARQSAQLKLGMLIWELRSVNHRYLDITLRLPESLRLHEVTMRERIGKVLNRGKIEAVLKFNPGEILPFDFVLNQALLKKLAQAANAASESFTDANVNITDILSWPGVLQTQDTHMEQLAEASLDLLASTLKDMVTMRHREGKGISAFLQQNLLAMNAEVDQVEKRLPQVIAQERERILERFTQLKLEVDQTRFEQEMLYIIQKMDVAEELQRLRVHLNEVKRIVSAGGVAGRRLDFLMQELNREANTLSSKSADAQVTKAAVEMKVLIEQMREQVQNIE